MSVLQRESRKAGTNSRCPFHRGVHFIESNKGSQERQGPTLGVRFTEVSVLQGCPLKDCSIIIDVFVCI